MSFNLPNLDWKAVWNAPKTWSAIKNDPDLKRIIPFVYRSKTTGKWYGAWSVFSVFIPSTEAEDEDVGVDATPSPQEEPERSEKLPRPYPSRICYEPPEFVVGIAGWDASVLLQVADMNGHVLASDIAPDDWFASRPIYTIPNVSKNKGLFLHFKKDGQYLNEQLRISKTDAGYAAWNGM